MHKTAAVSIKTVKNSVNINIADLLICLSFFIEIVLLFSALIITDTQQTEIFLFINIYILFFSIILDLLIMGINKHFPVFAFYCCYFIFLLGRKFVQCFSSDIATVYNSFSTKFVQATLYGTDYLIFTSLLYISLITSFLFYKIFIMKKHSNVNVKLASKTSARKINIIRSTTQVMSWVTLIFALLERIIVLKARAGMSYVESYQIIVDVPVIIKIFNAMFESCVFIFLATKPKKSAMWPILVLYLIIDGVLSTINGNRLQLGTCLLLVICYLLFYFKINIKKFKLRWLLYFLIFGVVVLCVFWYIEVARSDKAIQNTSLIAILGNILDSLGGSDSVIAGIIMRADSFPKNGIVYLFSPIKRAVTDNPVMRIFIGVITGQMPISYGQGMDALLHYDSFADWFSYIGSPSLYLSGSGSGSSYIAECYFAFGFVGVIFISCALGIIIAKITSMDFSNGKIYKNALGLFLLSQLFILPRGSTFAFATPLLYFAFTVLLCKLFESLLYSNPNKCVSGARG